MTYIMGSATVPSGTTGTLLFNIPPVLRRDDLLQHLRGHRLAGDQYGGDLRPTVFSAIPYPRLSTRSRRAGEPGSTAPPGAP